MGASTEHYTAACQYEPTGREITDGRQQYRCRNCGHVRLSAYGPELLHRACAKPAVGVGAYLSRMLRRVGLRGCLKCGQHAKEMDRRGADWCEANLETIVGWLREGAERRRLPFSERLAAWLVRRAIERSRQAR